MRKGFSDIQWVIKDMAAGGNKVAVTWKCTGTYDGEFMGVKPTGKKFIKNYKVGSFIINFNLVYLRLKVGLQTFFI